MWERVLARASSAACRGRFWQQRIPSREPEPGYLALGVRGGGVRPVPVRHADRDGGQAAVPWSAQTRLTDGGTKDPGGLLRFGADGHVVEDRDFWAQG